MNTSNITNYKPKDFAELLGVSVKTSNDEIEMEFSKQIVLQLIEDIILTTNTYSLKEFKQRMI